jgi:hypothetical protein
VAPWADLPRANSNKGLDYQIPPSARNEPKRVFGAVANLPAFPLVIAEWDRNSREVIRIALDKYNGRLTVNARVWYHDGATLKPGKSGMTLAITHLPALADALGKALEQARDLGLIEAGGEQ